MNFNMNITRGIINSVEKHPDKTAIIFKDHRVSYAEFNSRANRIANYFLNRGLRRADRVGVLLFNCPECIEIYTGLAKAGIIFVPINSRFAPPEIEYVANHAEISGLIFGQEFTDSIDSLKGRLPLPKENCFVTGQGTDSSFKDYEEILQEGKDSEPSLPISEEDILYVVYTSGTTGFPKGVVVLHKTYLECWFQNWVEHGIHGKDVGLIVMPLFHGNSIYFSLLSMFIGGTIHIVPSSGFDGEEILRIIQESRITFASLIPTMYNIILNLPDGVKSSYDVRSLRILFSSSAPLWTKTKEAVLNFFKNADLYEFYGAVEVWNATSLKPIDQWRKVRCAGKPFIGKEVKILDPDGNEVKTGEVGELYCRGIGMSQGYLNDPEATQNRRRGDWVTVGDMARFDDEGYVYLVDRKNDMMITGGENVFPSEVEEVLSRHPAIFEVAVIGAPDEKWGDAIKAVVVLKPGIKASPEEIIQFCRGKLAGYKIPKSVDFVPELPKTPTGKILRRLVRKHYWKDFDVKI